jgi:hypothetical protein
MNQREECLSRFARAQESRAGVGDFASFAIPEAGGGPIRFFADAARELLEAAVVGYLAETAPEARSLEGLLGVVKCRQRLQALLVRTEEGRNLLASLSHPEQVLPNVLATLQIYLSRLTYRAPRG